MNIERKLFRKCRWGTPQVSFGHTLWLRNREVGKWRIVRRNLNTIRGKWWFSQDVSKKDRHKWSRWDLKPLCLRLRITVRTAQLVTEKSWRQKVGDLDHVIYALDMNRFLSQSPLEIARPSMSRTIRLFSAFHYQNNSNPSG